MPSQISPEQLGDVDLLRGLTAGDLTQLLAVCEDVKFNANDVIFKSGDAASSLFVLLQGEVEVLLEAPHHLQTSLATLKPKTVFGESSFFGGGQHHATLRCVSPVEAIRLNRADFDQLAAGNSLAALRIGTNAAVILAIRLQTADQRIACVVQEEQDIRIKNALHQFHQSMVHSFGNVSSFIHTTASQ